MTASTRHAWQEKKQRGVALLTALLLMLAVLMTSIAAARTAISGARAAGHERDRMLALQGAMAALADAEHDIEGGSDPASARAAALANGAAAAFAGSCRGGTPYEGLCGHAPDAGTIFAALADEAGPAVSLGSFTDAHIPAGEGGLAAHAPRYLIERMPPASGSLLYRISALGFGSSATTQVAVQAYYLKLLAAGTPGGPAPPGTEPAPGPDAGPGSGQGPGPAAGPGPRPGPAPAGPGQDLEPDNTPPTAAGAPGTPGGPGIRVGWREIGNWHDSVAAAGASAGRERR